MLVLCSTFVILKGFLMSYKRKGSSGTLKAILCHFWCVWQPGNGSHRRSKKHKWKWECVCLNLLLSVCFSSRCVLSAPESRRQLDRPAQLPAVSAQPANQEEEPSVQRVGERVRRRLSVRRDGIRLRAGRRGRLGCGVATVPPQAVRWDLLHGLAARPRVDLHPAPSHHIAVLWTVHQHRDSQLRLRGLVRAVSMSPQSASQPTEEERAGGHTPASSSPAALPPTPSPELLSVSTAVRGAGCEL